MIALGFLLVLVLYVALASFLAWFLPRHFEQGRAKVIATTAILLAFALIPTWDIIPGRLYFNYLCETEGGVKIYRTVEGVEGFLDREGIAFPRINISKFGYRYVEGEDGSGVLYRYSIAEDGKLKKMRIRFPTSRYEIYGTTQDFPLGIKKETQVILDKESKDKLGEKVVFYRAGNWVQRRSKPLLGGGDYCPSAGWTELLQKNLYSAILKPSAR